MPIDPSCKLYQRDALRLAMISALLAYATGACSSFDDDACSNEPGVVCTIAGTGVSGLDRDSDTTDYPALQTLLSLPIDTLTDPEGITYLVDFNNHRLRSLHQGVIRWVAGTGELGGSLDDPGEDEFNHPTNIIFDASGENILIAAWHNSQVRKLNLATSQMEDVAGDGRRAYFGDGGPAQLASFDLPSALALDPQGDLVIMDQTNQVVRAIDAEGTIRRIAGQCLIHPPGSGNTDACLTPVSCPEGESGPSGKLVCGGDISMCTYPCSPGYAGDEAQAAEMRMAQPFGGGAAPSGRMLFDRRGNLFFADTGNHLIRMIDSDGIVHRIAGRAPIEGQAQSGYAGDGGDAREALLNFPVDLALSDDDTLYFTDVNNHCIRSIAPDYTIETVAGICGERGFSGDGGPAEEALFFRPFGIEWTEGRLLISDTGNHVIRSVRVGP